MFDWDASLTKLLPGNNPDAIFDLDFYKINFSEWHSMYVARKQFVHIYAGGPECTPYATPGKYMHTANSRADQVAGMADSGRKLAILVILVKNVPDIEGHDLTL